MTPAASLGSVADHVYLGGTAVMRNATVAWPADVVEDMLAPGLRLGLQWLTPDGQHPVHFFFYEIFDAQMSVPTLVPSLTYRELVVAIPHCHHARSGRGPFVFMPRLLLDDPLAILGGNMFWGFAKREAEIHVDDGRYCVHDDRGRRLVSLEFEPAGRFRDPQSFDGFGPMRRALDQPLISQYPPGRGPMFLRSDFEREWSTAQMRPLETVLRVHAPVLPGMPRGRVPEAGATPGAHLDVLGSYELRTRWRQRLAAPLDLSPMRRRRCR